MTVFKGLNSIVNLREICAQYKGKNILVVSGKKSFEASGAAAHIRACSDLCTFYFFDDFEVNPRLSDALTGVDLAIKHSVALIISVGGGSVLDMGKLIKALYCHAHEAESVIKGFIQVNDPGIQLVAIPTTAGSGSEATHFSVVYISDAKYSLASPCLSPDYVILDGNLTMSASRYQKACNVLDALSQSIESAWAVGSTPESARLSFQALEFAMKFCRDFVRDGVEAGVAQGMLEAANLAGQAINITKTTAAHAWSYGLTKRYGISHGHAVWFTLPAIFEIHADTTCADIIDKRGKCHLDNVMAELARLLNMSPKQPILDYFKIFLAGLGISADLTIDLCLSRQERLELSTLINAERMSNNPVAFSPEQIDIIFQLD